MRVKGVFGMISIIIPTLEEENYLPRLLQDIKRQTLKPREIIVVDAHSKDKTALIAAQEGCRVLTTHARNPGKQRNIGARNAKGSILVFIDADIRMRNKGTIEELFWLMESHVGATACIDIISSEATFADTLICWPANLAARWFTRYAGRGGLMAVQREVFEKVGGFDERRVVTEDLHLFRRIAKQGSVACLTSRVEESSRRYRKVGHLKVVLSWIKNAAVAFVSGHSSDKEWRPVR